jgi:hypothetical protein
MKDKTIMIGIGSRPESDPMGAEVEELEESDQTMFEEMAPRGDFTSRGLDPLVRATNKLLPLFDQTGDYPMVEDTKQLPPDFTRILAMFAGAVGDAIDQDVLNPEMAIQIDNVRDDSALMTIAGKLDMLSKDREFKRFLKEPVEEDEMAEEMREETGATPMSEEDEDDMMMGRM